VLSIDTQESSFDTVLGVYRGSRAKSAQLLATNDNAAPAQTFSRVIIPHAVAHQPYFIKVDGADGASGEVVLHAFLGNVQPPIIDSIDTTSGPPGTKITLHGTNLYCYAPTFVEVDGVDADLIRASEDLTTMVIKVPHYSHREGFLKGARGPVSLQQSCGQAISTQSFTLK
jgi:hypothetical protein